MNENKKTIIRLARRPIAAVDVREDPPRGEGAQSRDVPGREEFDEVERGDPSSLRDAIEQFDRLPIGQAAWGGSDDGWHD